MLPVFTHGVQSSREYSGLQIHGVHGVGPTEVAASAQEVYCWYKLLRLLWKTSGKWSLLEAMEKESLTQFPDLEEYGCKKPPRTQLQGKLNSDSFPLCGTEGKKKIEPTLAESVQKQYPLLTGELEVSLGSTEKRVYKRKVRTMLEGEQKNSAGV